MTDDYTHHFYINKEGIDSLSGGLGIWLRSQAIRSAEAGKTVTVFSTREQLSGEFLDYPISFAHPAILFELSIRLFGLNLSRKLFGKFGWDSEDFIDYLFATAANLFLRRHHSRNRHSLRVTIPLYGGIGCFISSRFHVEIALVSSTRDAIDGLQVSRPRHARHYTKIIQREELSLKKHFRRVSVSKSIHLRYGLDFTSPFNRIDNPRVYDQIENTKPSSYRVARRGYEERENSILFIGRCEPRKGFDLLLKIWELAHQELPGFELILIGDTYENQKVATGRASGVKCLGIVFDFEKSNLLNSAKIVLIPSRYESFGIVAIEAMSFGTPVVVGNIGGLSDIAEMSPSVVACEVGDTRGFTEKLVTIVTDSKIWDLYSRKLREDFKKFYKLN